ncbi:cupin domain-containing protein [Streptomyces sp. NPDC050516]|uniref:cupin domain-containing protein n=1 Tax=Streptomyces sp. NPDC050516 TaxID=3365621 RepID=UPI003796D1F5
MAASAHPFAVGPGDGTPISLPIGGSGTIMADGARTDGALVIMELVVPSMQGPGLHIHSREDEVWYVLEGEFRFRASDAMFSAAEGGLAFGPRDVPHTFQNVGHTPGRLLVVSAPAGMEEFFQNYTHLLPDPADQAALAELGHAAGVSFVGPPLAVSDPL